MQSVDFGLNNIQGVRFWNKTFSTCQTLINYLHQKNHVLVHFNPWERRPLHFSCSFKTHDFDLKISLRVRFWTKKTQRVRFWIQKKIQSVRLSVKVFRTSQFLNQLLKQVSVFELKILQRVRFWVYFFCSLPSFHAFIITSHLSLMF